MGNTNWLILNVTHLLVVWGSIKTFKNLNIKKKEWATNLSKTRLSKPVSTNLIEQLGSATALCNSVMQPYYATPLFSDSQMVVDISGEGKFHFNRFKKLTSF